MESEEGTAWKSVTFSASYPTDFQELLDKIFM
jgi:hypothetical protein